MRSEGRWVGIRISVTPPSTLKHSHRAELDLQPLQAFFLILLRTEYRSAYLSNKKIQKLVLGS